MRRCGAWSLKARLTAHTEIDSLRARDWFDRIASGTAEEFAAGLSGWKADSVPWFGHGAET